jgi:hypothetical protein
MTTTLDNIIYTISGSSAIVTGYTSGYNSYSISPIVFINSVSYTVTGIANNAFLNNTLLTSIIIPSTVTSIGYSTFQGCINLGSISCENVDFLGNSTFAGCTNLVTVTMPSLVDCGLYAFDDCTSLQSIDISSLNNIAPALFYGCTSLSSVTLSPNLNTISNQAFQNCSSLLNLSFTGTLSTIQNMVVGSNVFHINTTFNFSSVYSYESLNGSSLTNGYPSSLYNYEFANEPLPCFLADSKVLTDKGLVPIQLLKKGDLVQTLNDGLLPVKFVGMRSFFNKLTEERINAHLYKLNKIDFPELLEDLFITGGHPLLVDDVDEETKKKLLDMSDNSPIITEGKFRVFACIHPKAELWNDEKEHDIFDIVLENEDPKKNIGIWVNGILTESMDEDFFLNNSGMTEINKK